MNDSPGKAQDRRQSPRVKLAEVAYIGMGPENGGLVLDVSEGGLSFHAVAPVQPAENIRFLLSLRSQSRIEGAGQVVWTNEMRTICGLKFTSLSIGAREHLSNWTNPSRPTVSDREKVTLPPLPPFPPLAAQPQMEGLGASQANSSESDAAPIFAIPPADEPYLTDPIDGSRSQKSVLFWIMLGLWGAALVVAAYSYGLHVGRSQISISPQATANTGPAPVPPMPSAASVPAPVATGAPSLTGAPASGADVPSAAVDTSPVSKSALTNPVDTNNASGNSARPPINTANAASAPAEPAEQQSEAGRSELTAALANLNAPGTRRDSSEAAKLLWAAVGKGNSAAEVVLADLYLRGDGVAKSCDQGRILLIAASKSGSSEAGQKLKNMITNGCR
jgi:hypothetical protein